MRSLSCLCVCVSACPQFQVLKKVTPVRLEVFKAVTMKNAVFWDVALCDSCKNRHSSEKSVPTKAAWRHISQGGIFKVTSITKLDMNRGHPQNVLWPNISKDDAASVRSYEVRITLSTH
jgi:hypothetical protein